MVASGTTHETGLQPRRSRYPGYLPSWLVRGRLDTPHPRRHKLTYRDPDIAAHLSLGGLLPERGDEGSRACKSKQIRRLGLVYDSSLLPLCLEESPMLGREIVTSL